MLFGTRLDLVVNFYICNFLGGSIVSHVTNVVKTSSRKRTLITLSLGVLAMVCFMIATGYAANLSIGGVASDVTQSMSNIAKLITAGSYVAGFGFAVGAILKFKAHKDNPTQIPVGTPIALIFIAAALIFLPAIFGVAEQTVFGGSASVGGPSGIATFG